MTEWQLREVPFKFQLSDWSIFSVIEPLQVRSLGLSFNQECQSVPTSPPAETLMEGSRGYMIRGMPVSYKLPVISNAGEFFVYVPQQYSHYFIDMRMTFQEYTSKFSSKTRSTIRRKVRKFTEESGGKVRWETYSRPEQMPEFFDIARKLSAMTYQERVFDGGIPSDQTFIGEAITQARNDMIRAFILFHDDIPVSYLYCPVVENTLIYAYLGYHPEFQKLSAGTVLQWLALEQLFSEERFHYFDFTEGQSEHKRLFSTDNRNCANIYWLKKGSLTYLLIYSHHLMNRISVALGDFAERHGIKAKVKRFLRSRS